jgi:EpsD family peptidyl-prolyl cis-trans isomerase
MNPWAKLALIAGACAALADCKPPWPTAPARDPVLATVGGRKITAEDLKAEMATAPATDAAHRKMAEESVLRDMIARDILAQAARAQGLDKTAAFQRDKARLVDTLLVQSLQRKLAATAAAPTPAQAQAFMASHPDIFAQRKIFTLDQIRMAPPSDPALVKALGGQTSLDQIAQILTRNKVAFQRNAASLDALGAQPELVEALAKVPPGQLFVLPQGGVLAVNQIIGAKTVPFTGPEAQAYAQKILSAEGTQTAVQSGLKAIFVKSAKQVKIAKGYEASDPVASLGPPASLAPAH